MRSEEQRNDETRPGLHSLVARRLPETVLVPDQPDHGSHEEVDWQQTEL